MAPVLKAALLFSKTLLKAILICAVLAVLLQDLLVFQNLGTDFEITGARPADSLPPDTSSMMLKTSDGNSFELLRMVPKDSNATKRVAVLFHGQAGRVDNFVGFLKWFAEHGYVAYEMEYRGYGYSSGWPTISRLLSDAELSIRTIAEREGVATSAVLPVGVSFGTGFAAQMAERFSSTGLVLITPYTSLREAAANKPIFKYLRWFMWSQISALEPVSKLVNTCVVDVHGTMDEILPYEHSEKLEASYHGTKSFLLVTAPNESHGSAFWKALPQFTKAMSDCGLVSAR